MKDRLMIHSRVMKYAVAMQGVMYHLYMAHQCWKQARKQIRRYVQNEAPGQGSRFGEGQALISSATSYENHDKVLHGNHLIAKVAIDLGLEMPESEDVYAAAVEAGVIPQDYTVAFR